MRRLAFISLAVVMAACYRGEAHVGDQSAPCTPRPSVDPLMARVGSQLSRLGFDATATSEGLIFTAPRAMPESVAPATAGTPQMWFVHVVTQSQRFTTGASAV